MAAAAAAAAALPSAAGSTSTLPISSARRLYTPSSALRSRLLAGMTTSTLNGMPSVLEMPTTGTPAFVASVTACASACGSETTTTLGSV